MKGLKIAKYQVTSTLFSIGVYYAIFLFGTIFLMGLSTDGKSTMSGGEISTAIFLFVIGLNAFKSSFLISQANNVSRKSFFKGMILGVFPVTLGMAVIDIIICQIQNCFMLSLTTYDMIYGSLKRVNDVQTVLQTLIWLFVLYSTVYIVGILISMCYYRSNKPLKIAISVAPVALMILLSFFDFGLRIENFVVAFFGYQSQNPYIAFINLTITCIIFVGGIYLLMRKAPIK